MSRESAPDSFERIFRKKVRGISLLDTTSQTLFRPALGRQFMVTNAFLKVKRTAGTNSDAPNIIIDNGTNGQDIVAAVDTLVAEGSVQRLTVVGNRVVDYGNPLRLRKADAADGSTVFNVDLIFTLVEISS